MSAISEVYARYEAYLEEINKVIASAKPGAGLFGIGLSPKNDPCNDRFLSGMQEWLDGFAQRQPSSDEVRDVLAYIYTVQKDRRQDFVFFCFCAVHGFTEPLVKLLTQEAAGALAEAYEKDVPRVQRLPRQQTLLDALYEQAGQKPRRKGLFGFGRA